MNSYKFYVSRLQKISHRIYSDYLIGDGRLDLYTSTIEYALQSGYKINTVFEYFENKKKFSHLNSLNRLIISRHDIDTDPKTARKIFEIEKNLNIKSSYYFRLSTLDTKLMREIHEYGSEVGYHYEELATYSKRKALKNRDDVLRALPDIQLEFIHNFERIKLLTGIAMNTVCSHGDFANRYLKTYNWEIMTETLRKQCSIDAEVYDDIIQEDCLRIIDGGDGSTPWASVDPLDAISQGVNRIHLLTHPRSWRASFWYNTKENLIRMIEGTKYSLYQ